MDMWNNNNPVTDYDIEVPSRITGEVTCYDIAAITQGGCASGAYMPAVTYHTSLMVMTDHGDAVLDYIEEQLGALPDLPTDTLTSWSGMASFYLSYAVELWAMSVESELEGIEEDKAATG